MVAAGADFLYVLARRVLLDALDALEAQRRALVVVGAQAVYLRTGPGAIRSAPYTTDADLAVDPRTLSDEPELEAAMQAAGFQLMEPEPGRIQPGLWHKYVDAVPAPVDATSRVVRCHVAVPTVAAVVTAQ